MVVVHHTPPTDLPPSGAAGGDLAGTYPNPTLGADSVASAEIVDGSVASGDLAFDPATQAELDAHAVDNPSAHHAPTVDTDTTCDGAGCDGTSFSNVTAVAGDSATAFFASGQIEEPRLADEMTRDSELRTQVTALKRCAIDGWRFADMGDGTVLDCNTGLYWLKDASCDELGPHGDGTAVWSTALTAAAGLADGACALSDGSTAGDWRLAKIAEFCSQGATPGICPAGNSDDSLINSNFSNPALGNAKGDAQWADGDAFVGLENAYWSSSGAGTSAWTATTNSGTVLTSLKSAIGIYIWPVRGPD